MIGSIGFDLDCLLLYVHKNTGARTQRETQQRRDKAALPNCLPLNSVRYHIDSLRAIKHKKKEGGRK